MAVHQDGSELRLRPKAFALLCYFLDNPGRVLGRDELIERMWPRIAVTDDSLTQCVGDLRRALGDRAVHVLRTLPRRGYLLIAQVRQEACASETQAFLAPGPQGEPDPVSAARNVPAFRRETMTVHRFETPDGDQACVRLADGLAIDLVVALTCLEGLRIHPASDAASYVGYRVKGEVRAVGQALRITVRLEDVATGTALWADRLAGEREHPAELPETELTALVIHLAQQVDRHCLALARHKPLAALSARELHLIGRDHHQRNTEPDIHAAERMFALAMVADPGYAHAYAWQAYTLHRATIQHWGGPVEQAACKTALRLAQRGVQIDPTSPLCLSRLAFTLMLNRQWDDAVVAARMALTSDRPAFTAARNPCCEVLAHAGLAEEATAVAQGTITLDPLCSPITYALLGRAMLLAGRAEEALPALRLCTSRMPDYAPAFDSVIVAAIETERVAEAIVACREVERLAPHWLPRNNTGLWFFRQEIDLERFHAAYVRATAECAA